MNLAICPKRRQDAALQSRRKLRHWQWSVAAAIIIALAWFWAAKIRQNALDRQLVKEIDKGHAREVESLLQRGADPNVRLVQQELNLIQLAKQQFLHQEYDRYPPPLLMAMEKDQREIVRSLVRHGADVRVKDDSGRTALMDACWEGDYDFARELVAKGVDWRAVDIMGTTALANSCRHDDDRIARMLLDLGAPVDGPKNSPAPPLYMAARYGSAPVVRLLLQRGADPSWRGVEGGTALHTAGHVISFPATKRDRRALEVARLLIAAGADPKATTRNGYTTLMSAMMRPALARLLVSLGVPVNAKTKDGRTAMSVWTNPGGSEECCLILLEHGADPNEKDLDGKTPLMYAIPNHMPRAYRALLRHGAEVNVKCTYGWGALDCAIEADDPAAVRLLARAGANITKSGYQGLTPLQQATKGGKLKAKAALEGLLAGAPRH